MCDYDEFEKECKKIKKENEEYLKLFEEELTAAGLSSKTIRNHIFNVDFFINDYMLREEPQTIDLVPACLDTFLGYYFIHKCMWSTPQTIKSTAASIKKFYKCMLNHGKIEKDDYDFLCSEIKDNMEDWQDECAVYNGSY